MSVSRVPADFAGLTVLVVGSKGVGKSTFIRSYFRPQPQPSATPSVHLRFIEISDPCKLVPGDALVIVSDERDRWAYFDSLRWWKFALRGSPSLLHWLPGSVICFQNRFVDPGEVPKSDWPRSMTTANDRFRVARQHQIDTYLGPAWDAPFVAEVVEHALRPAMQRRAQRIAETEWIREVARAYRNAWREVGDPMKIEA